MLYKVFDVDLLNAVLQLVVVVPWHVSIVDHLNNASVILFPLQQFVECELFGAEILRNRVVSSIPNLHVDIHVLELLKQLLYVDHDFHPQL